MSSVSHSGVETRNVSPPLSFVSWCLKCISQTEPPLTRTRSTMSSAVIVDVEINVAMYQFYLKGSKSMAFAYFIREANHPSHVDYKITVWVCHSVGVPSPLRQFFVDTFAEYYPRNPDGVPIVPDLQLSKSGRQDHPNKGQQNKGQRADGSSCNSHWLGLWIINHRCCAN